MLAAGLVLVGIMIDRFMENPTGDYSCSRPGQENLTDREEFVRTHVSDASSFSLNTYDCEDGGSATLSFTTSLTPDAARDSFLSLASCSPYSTNGVDEAVTCDQGQQLFYVYFATTQANPRLTQGELRLTT